ncbi:MAG: cystathionine gamma-synthase [Gammaproteobacteria bacterium]|nr:cystathionine gamma-synthase [Gammaproteobacteria bacterium]
MSRRQITSMVRAGVDSDNQYGSVMPPLYLSSNYSFEGLYAKREYDYSRSGNPTRELLGNALAELEGGSGSIVTNTGMSAVVLVTYLLTAKDTIIAPHNCYGGCYRVFDSLSQTGRFKARFSDFSDLDTLRGECSLIRPKVIWVETPSNPLLRITDIQKVAAIARECNALLVVDNTFLTPLGQQPLTLGADIVVHSTTKYINGHSDVVGGAVIAADASLLEKLSWWANCVGSTASPFDCSQVLRGLRTLHARLRCHEENALQLAHILAVHPVVSCVHYPGLNDHPDHQLASRQQSWSGAIISFELYGGEQAVKLLLEGLACFTLAESLGGVESLICHPASMTHGAMSEEAQIEAGIGKGLLRLSVGIEDGQDLEEDLIRGLEKVQSSILIAEAD